GLVVAEKQQYHGDAGGDPAGYERYAEQRRQHETDAAHHHVGQGHVIGQAEILFQQRDHRQADHEHDQRLQHLRGFPAVMHEGQAHLERAEGPVRLFVAVTALENLHEGSPSAAWAGSCCCENGAVLPWPECRPENPNRYLRAAFGLRDQSALAISRRTNFWILPVLVFGNWVKTTVLGTLNPARCSRQKVMISLSLTC